jgi:hypothetical protein
MADRRWEGTVFFTFSAEKSRQAPSAAPNPRTQSIHYPEAHEIGRYRSLPIAAHNIPPKDDQITMKSAAVMAGAPISVAN